MLNAQRPGARGVHLMDNAAPEIVQALAVSLRLGLKASHLKMTLPLRPTVAEEMFG